MADKSTADGSSDDERWADHRRRDAITEASLLLVEDDPAIRDMLVTMLEFAGFAVTACSSAEGALEALREESFDLVLTDYLLPHRTGGWLLEQAGTEGLIEATPVLVLTAHPHPADLGGYEILSKPFDLDHLVSRVRQHLVGPTRRPKMPFSSTLNGEGIKDGKGGHTSARVELILYVSASPRCAAAIRTIKGVVSRFSHDRVTLTIHDLSTDPSQGVEDSIAYTPTLVRRLPRPRTFLMGDISNPDVVVELLQGAGEEGG